MTVLVAVQLQPQAILAGITHAGVVPASKVADLNAFIQAEKAGFFAADHSLISHE